MTNIVQWAGNPGSSSTNKNDAGGGNSGSGSNISVNVLIYQIVQDLYDTDPSTILYACEDCSKIDKSVEIGSLYKYYLKTLNHFEKKVISISKTVWGEELSNDSNWMGEEGWKNYGYPTMAKTWGTLSTVVSLGAYSMSTMQLFNTSFIGNATYGQARRWMWDGFSLGIGTYNLINPNNTYGNKISPYVDVVDLGIRRSPISAINWGFRGYNFYNNINTLNR